MSCRWCGKPYEQHLVSRPLDAPAPRMPCGGLRAFYWPEDAKVIEPSGKAYRTDDEVDDGDEDA